MTQGATADRPSLRPHSKSECHRYTSVHYILTGHNSPIDRTCCTLTGRSSSIGHSCCNLPGNTPDSSLGNTLDSSLGDNTQTDDSSHLGSNLGSNFLNLALTQGSQNQHS